MPLLNLRSESPENRRYEVFISSTSEDLREIRRAVISETTVCGHIPTAMEHFAAETTSDQAFLQRRIEECDIFVILIGARYGSTPLHGRLTFTRQEYDIAVRLGKPILAFMLNEDEYREARSALREGDPERKHDRDLRRFRDLVKQHEDGNGRIVKFFSLKPDRRDEIVEGYQRALGNAVRSLNGRGGWVRGSEYDQLSQGILIKPLASGNIFFQKIVDSLEGLETLHARCANNVELKKAVTTGFLDLYLGRIALYRDALFFESGSTIAYLFDDLQERVHLNWVRTFGSKVRVETNNILVYLRGTFSGFGRIDLYPHGPPEAKYGATFGSLTSLPEVPPTARGREFPDVAADISEHFNQTFQHGLLLMAMSGFDTEAAHMGPHVGSYYNALFKRALLQSHVPTVLLMFGPQFERPFQPGLCYSICDENLGWETICAQKPFAVAVAFSGDQHAQSIGEFLKKYGLSHHDERRLPSGIIVLVCSNDAFQGLFRGERPGQQFP
jgi:Domain of unknown function (DUF4062)